MPQTSVPRNSPRSVSVPHSRQVIIRSAVFAACVLATACTTVLQPGRPPNVTLSTPTGPVPLAGPGSSPIAEPSLTIPPRGTLPTPANTMGRNGTYAGYADVLATGGGLCLNDKTVANFKVHGNQAQLGEMKGTIAPNGYLQMVYGDVWVTGAFQGPTFRGQMTAGGPAGCTFALELDRVRALIATATTDPLRHQQQRIGRMA